MEITAQMVKELREQTGAAVLDCKKVLEETGGDFDKAKELLTQKGLAQAAKKADREASEGIVEAYQHAGGRVGVLVEVNCETDFVAKTDQFQALVRDLALHIAFANPQYLDEESVPAEVVSAQQTVFRAEAEETGKPAEVVGKIVEGKMAKFYEEVCLLNQPFVKDDEMTVGEKVTASVAELQENIRIRRFARFELGVEENGDES